MNSRVHPKYKTKYRVSNWAEYDRALVQRGDITLWISEDATDTWSPEPSGKRGGQRKFSDQAIETALVLRLVFNLPLRQTEEFLRSLLSLMALGPEAPDHTTISRRSQQVDVSLRLAATKGRLHLIVDSTGLSIIGEGEWADVKHGGRGKRAWKKLHLGIDRSGAIVAEVLTEGDAHDSNTARDLTVRRVRKVGRHQWKKESGYHRQAGSRREHLLQVQVDRWRPAACASSQVTGGRGVDRMQHPQPDDGAWPAKILRDRSVIRRPTTQGVGAIAYSCTNAPIRLSLRATGTEGNQLF
jgi:hypothetical protein